MKEDKKLNIFVHDGKSIPKDSEEFFNDETFEDYNPSKQFKTIVGGEFEIRTVEFSINLFEWSNELGITEQQLHQQIGRMIRDEE